jgi:hypothetical protein
MTFPAETLKDWGEIPDGTQWPKPGTLVLLNRDLRPGTDRSALSRFRDDRWDLNPAIFEDHEHSRTMNFGLVPAELRLAAKFYIWQLLNHTRSQCIGRIGARLSVASIHNYFVNALQFVLGWFARQGITAFCQITPQLLDRYLEALIDEDLPLVQASRRLLEVRRLWAHREILPASMRLPDTPLWDGEDTQDLLGTRWRYRVNRTPRIGEPTMQMLLHWAIRFVEDLADDIIAAHNEYLELRSRTPSHRRRSGCCLSRKGQHWHRPGELEQTAAAYLQGLRDRGEPLPGRRGEDGQLEICWRRVAAFLDYGSSTLKYTAVGRMIGESGLPIGEHAYLSPPVTGLLDGRPWRPDRIHYHEAVVLARLLSTACFIIVAYLSGARAGEVLNLRRGCITHDQSTGLWLMSGLYFKSAGDENGSKVPEGQIRPDPWVVIELVATAVAALERLHPSELLFPNLLEPRNKPKGDLKRLGEARPTESIKRDLEAFRAWVNAYCLQHNRADQIPGDGRGTLAPSRFRRTLAWFIRRRPRGLIAASIQYGHAYTRMLQGYAGSYESGFPDEYAFEDWLFRLEGLAEDEQALAAGEHVSGPAADAYRYRVTAANREFGGRVLASRRATRDLLGNPLLQIHHGEGMTCVLNPATAACQLRGAADDPMVTPDTDDCRPRCPNLARTDRDIEHVKQRAAELAEIVADPLAPPIRNDRERRELERLHRIIEVHQQGTATP